MDDMNQPPKNKNNYTLFPETMAHEVTENWYNKKDDSNPELRAPFGQIIWSDTVLMGVGVKKISNSERKEYAIVCNYYPPGNVELNG